MSGALHHHTTLLLIVFLHTTCSWRCIILTLIAVLTGSDLFHSLRAEVVSEPVLLCELNNYTQVEYNQIYYQCDLLWFTVMLILMLTDGKSF